MRVVLVAASERDAARWVERQPNVDGVVVEWVSPRSPHRARGTTADAVLATDAAHELEPDVLEGLLLVVAPCVAGVDALGRERE